MGSTNLHTRAPFDGEQRPLIPDDPARAGYKVQTFEMSPPTYWFMMDIRGISLGQMLRRAIQEKASASDLSQPRLLFDPRPGQGAAFTKQISVRQEIYYLIAPLFLWFLKTVDDAWRAKP